MWFKDLFKKQVSDSNVTNNKTINLYEKALDKCKRGVKMWVKCKGYSNYKVSNMGDVFFTKKGILVRQRETSNGSKVVSLRRNNKSITCSVAKLVASSFEIPNEKGKKNVYHINEISNNRLDNLSFDDEYSILFESKNYKKDKEYIEMNKKSLYEEALEKCKNNEEMWVGVKDYPKYEVSNLGNCRNKKTKLIVGYKDNTEKTMKVQLQNGNKMKRTTMANIVAKNFEVPNPYDLHYAKNIDGNKFNCRLDNLSWSTNLKKRDEKLLKQEVEYSDKDRIDFEKSKIEKVDNEIWKDVVGYERWYEVSNQGNVRRIERDGSTTLLKATYKDGRPRSVGLRTTGTARIYNIKLLVAQAFNIKPTENNDRIIYNIDGDLSNDCASNLTYDYKQTEEYIKEQERKLKEEQAIFDNIYKEEQENHKKELFDYIESNKDFLIQAKEMSKQITLEDIYNKLNEILEVLKNDNR